MQTLIQDDKVLILASYDEREIIKSMGDYKWNKKRKVWEFPLWKLPKLATYFKLEMDAKTEEELLYQQSLNSDRAEQLEAAQQIKIGFTKYSNDYLYDKLFTHQKQALALASLFDSYALFMETGCVSCDTEFLTPDGWKRIDSYNQELVAQYNLDKKEVEFVNPIKYIKLPSTTMYHFKTKTGIDQLLSPEHRVLAFKATNNKTYVDSAENFFEKHQNHVEGCKLRIMTAFNLITSSQLFLTENELRLQIAAMADGTFPTRKRGNNTYCRIRLAKKIKIKRLKKLFRETKIKYHFRIDTDGQSSFEFQAPIGTKHFTKQFWKASFEQRKIICDEVQYWDASIRPGNRGPIYFCQHKDDADFIQYCFVSTNRRAVIKIGKNRGYKTTSYMVSVVGDGNTGNYAHIGRYKNNITKTFSPDGYKYCFEVPSKFLILRRNGCVFISGNTGKTLVAIRLIQMRQEPTLIVCPLSVIEGVWIPELKKWAPELTACNLWDHFRKKKTIDIPDSFDTYLINFESFKKIKHPEDYFKFIIIDESAALKCNKTQITKKFISIKDNIKYKLILSGLPAPNGIMEYWGQMAFINERLLGKNFYAFRNKYFRTGGYGGFQYYLKANATEEIMSKINEQAFHISKFDCLTLPDQLFEKRIIEMSKEQRQAYDDMWKQNIMEFKGHTTLAMNELSKIMKCREVTSGFVINEYGMPIFISDTKLKVLKAVLNDEISHEKQVIIWCNFHYEIEMIFKEFGDEACMLYGGIKQHEKDQNIKDFQNKKKRLLIAHPKTGGKGLTLVNSSYQIWFSLSYSEEDHKQATDRIHRIGQTEKCTYIYLLAKDSIDEVIHNALLKKKKISETCLAMLKG